MLNYLIKLLVMRLLILSIFILQVDVGDLPPLFCRPRRSPKLNPDSRHASLLGGLGAGSRRQSNVPRSAVDDTSSQYGGSSPVTQSFHGRKLERSPLFLTESISRTTLDNIAMQEEAQRRAVNIKLILDDFFVDTRPKFRKNARVLSTIASSSSTSDYPSQIVIRESRSLDQFPSDMYSKRFDSPNFSWKEPKKSFRSLENCVKCTRTNSKTDISKKVLNNNYPNGNVIIVPHIDNSPNEAEMPLLGDDGGCTGEILPIKRWRSLDHVSAPSTDSVPDKKSSARNSIRSWLVNLFNGNGLRNSDGSLRRGVIAGYDMQSERESIV